MGRAFITYIAEKLRKALPAFMRKWRWEMWSLPLLILVFISAREAIYYFDPQSGPYDTGVLHKIFLAAVVVSSGSLLSWILIRAYYREVWDHSESDSFKEDYDLLGQKWRVLINVLLFLGLLFAFVNAANGRTTHEQDCIIKIATSQLGVREVSGSNDGPEVEQYLSSVGLSKGYAWCAAFVGWTYDQCGIVHPKSAWCPAWFATGKVVYTKKRDGPLKATTPSQYRGSVFGIYYASKKRIAHVGIIEKVEGNYLLTIEGNTNSEGSREGDGVYRKRRLISQIHAIATYHQGGRHKDIPREI